MKIFLSSTCYDLKDLRPEIEKFLMSKGHRLLLSDRPNFPVIAEKHRHDVCLENVDRCDLFILVLDSRFGAGYYKNPEISITWAEFDRALTSNRRIIAFIRNEIFIERQIYNENKKQNITIVPFFADNPKTFELIDKVQKHESGIWIQQFNNSVEIKERLENLYETMHSPINDSTSEIYSGPLEIKLSGSTSGFIDQYIEPGFVEVTPELIEKAIKAIPAKSAVYGEILGFEERPSSTPYYYVTPIRHSGDEGEMIWGISPTALGLSIRTELEDFSKRLAKHGKKEKN